MTSISGASSILSTLATFYATLLSLLQLVRCYSQGVHCNKYRISVSCFTVQGRHFTTTYHCRGLLPSCKYAFPPSTHALACAETLPVRTTLRAVNLPSPGPSAKTSARCGRRARRA
ncbi:hypothetical protein K438DRAFT_1824548 [Mycena galopus ATCC 62051]|nr:hypothetical protein K438DRAFT_1824548 [Mycena galopus ATCC 62051]